MATSSHKARLVIGTTSFSPLVTSATVSNEFGMHDVTTLADTAKRFTPGLSGATFNCEGFVDATVSAFITATELFQTVLGTQTVVTYGPAGLALGSPTMLISGYKASYENGTVTVWGTSNSAPGLISSSEGRAAAPGRRSAEVSWRGIQFPGRSRRRCSARTRAG